MLTCGEIMEVKILRKQGLSYRELSKKLKKAVNTIIKYCKGGEFGYKKRPLVGSILDPYKEYIQNRIKAAKPKWIPAAVIFRELQGLGYSGKVRIVQEYMQGFKCTSSPEVMVRFETEPGQQMQVDWAHFVHKGKKFYAFVALLGYSRGAFVQFVEDMQIDTLLRCHENAFEYFGGITKEILYDNMKTIVIERHAYGSEHHRLNQIFYDFAKYHAFVPRLCRPYRAKTKGKVERFIKYLRESFFVPLYATAKQSGQELDLVTINVECTKWLNEVANQRIHQTTKQVPSKLLNKEREGLAIMHSSYFRSTDYKQDVIYSIVVPQHDLTVYENIERSL